MYEETFFVVSSPAGWHVLKHMADVRTPYSIYLDCGPGSAGETKAQRVRDALNASAATE